MRRAIVARGQNALRASRLPAERRAMSRRRPPASRSAHAVPLGISLFVRRNAPRVPAGKPFDDVTLAPGPTRLNGWR
jgi:hypothetical protein